MKYKVILHNNFEKEYKPLSKKFPSLKSDVQDIIDNLEKELILAKDLGEGFKKINLRIKSKGKGSSGGGRIVTYETIVSVSQTEVIFSSIYNKTDFDSISIPILKQILDL